MNNVHLDPTVYVLVKVALWIAYSSLAVLCLAIIGAPKKLTPSKSSTDNLRQAPVKTKV